MSKLLFSTYPLIVDKDLAILIGLNEALILQQIHYWVEINRKAGINSHDGKVWTYNSIIEWNKEFPFFSYDTVRRTLKKLKSMDLLYTNNYNKSPFDKTLWYSINYKKLDQIKIDYDNNKVIKETCVDNGKLPSSEIRIDYSIINTTKETFVDNGKLPSSPIANCTDLSLQIAPTYTRDLPKNSKTREKVSPSSQSEKIDKTDRILPADSWKSIEDKYKDQINYSDLEMAYPDGILVDVISNIMDMHYSEYVIVNKVKKDKELVIRNLQLLREPHIMHVINKYINLENPVYKKPNYIQAMLFNIVLEIELDIINTVNTVMR